MRLQTKPSLLVLSALLTLSLAACSDDNGGSKSSGDSGSGGTGGSSSTSTSTSATSTGTGGSSTTSTSSGGTGGDAEPDNMKGITQLHNDARASVDPPAQPPIPPLVWAADVAGAAQAHADKCVFEHSGGPYGENIYASTGGSIPADVVDSWVSEKANYDYATDSCSGTCGHYTQVVWAKSLKLGCGKATCNQNSPFGGGSWDFWVCNYDPPGNYNGEKPY